MKHFIMVLLSLFLSTMAMLAQEIGLQKYITNRSDIKEGGTGTYEFKNVTYIVTVSSLVVGTKNESQCKTVGRTKVTRDMLAYVNGSELTSSTVLINDESLDGRTVTSKQVFIESIRESVVGTIDSLNTLCGWYSEDKTVYYFAMYKIL